MSTKRLTKILTLAAFLGLATSCHKHDVLPETGSIGFNLQYHVDGKPLEFDILQYTNAAGNLYSVSKLHYYISNITLRKADGVSFTDREIHYVDARDGGTNAIQLENIPIGNYDGISLFIGINSDTNRTGTLPGTLENVNMAWPEPMGGGYHFMKLEGHFKDSLSTPGYAMHIGTNVCLVEVYIDHPFSVRYRTPEKKLKMNINEWFSTPVQYDFANGNYTMGIADKMLEIAQNGKDVFTLE